MRYELKTQMRVLKVFLQIMFLEAALLVTGCGQFFPKETTPPPSSSGNYLYVANSATTDIGGLGITTSGLSTLSNSPYQLGVAPSALALTPSNSFLYTSSLAGAIYAWTVGSNGALTIANSGNAVVTQISPVAVKVDTTGNWLIAVDLTPAAYVFAINTSTGALTQQGNAVPLDTGSPNRLLITPNDSLVYVSLGTGGVDILTFNSTSGVLTKTNQILKPKQSANADQGLASDPSTKYLFVAETGVNALRALTIGTNGALTEVSGSPFTTGLGPNGVIVDATGSYVYVANRTDGTITAFALSTTGKLTPIAGSPFTTGTNPVDLAEDKTHAYIAVACSGGSPDLQVFTVSTTTPGALTSFATAATGTDPTNAFAVVANQ